MLKYTAITLPELILERFHEIVEGLSEERCLNVQLMTKNSTAK